MNVNYLGVVYSARAVVPHLKKNGGGRIVFVSSVLGLMGFPGYSAYCASKVLYPLLKKIKRFFSTFHSFIFKLFESLLLGTSHSFCSLPCMVSHRVSRSSSR